MPRASVKAVSTGPGCGPARRHKRATLRIGDGFGPIVAGALTEGREAEHEAVTPASTRGLACSRRNRAASLRSLGQWRAIGAGAGLKLRGARRFTAAVAAIGLRDFAALRELRERRAHAGAAKSGRGGNLAAVIASSLDRAASTALFVWPCAARVRERCLVERPRVASLTLADEPLDDEPSLAGEGDRDSVFTVDLLPAAFEALRSVVGVRVRRRAGPAGADRSPPPNAASARRSLLASASS